MHVIDLISPDRVVLMDHSRGKAKLLTRIAELLAGSEAPATQKRALAQALQAREELGSTALGNGVAMPHARLESLTGPVAAFVRLREPMSFDQHGDERCDLFFAIATPQIFVETHLKLMSEVAALFDDLRSLKSLRAANNSEQLFARLNDWFLEAA
jgi:nitrogen PTS system EIIA component